MLTISKTQLKYHKQMYYGRNDGRLLVADGICFIVIPLAITRKPLVSIS